MRGLHFPRPDANAGGERRRGLIALVIAALLAYTLGSVAEAADWPESATLVAGGLLVAAFTAFAAPIIRLPRELAKSAATAEHAWHGEAPMHPTRKRSCTT